MSPSDKGIFLELLIEQWVLDLLPGDLAELSHITRSRVDVLKQWLLKWATKCSFARFAAKQSVNRTCAGYVREMWKRCVRDVKEMWMRWELDVKDMVLS